MSVFGVLLWEGFHSAHSSSQYTIGLVCLASWYFQIFNILHRFYIYIGFHGTDRFEAGPLNPRGINICIDIVSNNMDKLVH